jgi:competence protein ComEA
MYLTCCSCTVQVIEPLENKTITVQVQNLDQSVKTYTVPLYSKLSVILNELQCDTCDMTRLNPEIILKQNDLIVLYPIIDHRISINQATIIELQDLPGVGPSIAARIVEYRNTNGLFQSLEDIMRVKGIKEALFKKIEEHIRL